jgi:hypothetical protein
MHFNDESRKIKVLVGGLVKSRKRELFPKEKNISADSRI